MNSSDGVSAEELPALKAGILALADDKLAASRLKAKPWRGGCPECRGILWFADTEEEATRLVSEHIAEEHIVVPQVWRDHE
jgi:hypothetical protein